MTYELIKMRSANESFSLEIYKHDDVLAQRKILGQKSLQNISAIFCEYFDNLLTMTNNDILKIV